MQVPPAADNPVAVGSPSSRMTKRNVSDDRVGAFSSMPTCLPFLRMIVHRPRTAALLCRAARDHSKAREARTIRAITPMFTHRYLATNSGKLVTATTDVPTP